MELTPKHVDHIKNLSDAKSAIEYMVLLKLNELWAVYELVLGQKTKVPNKKSMARTIVAALKIGTPDDGTGTEDETAPRGDTDGEDHGPPLVKGDVRRSADFAPDNGVEIEWSHDHTQEPELAEVARDLQDEEPGDEQGTTPDDSGETASSAIRDPRLPPAGTILKRTYKGDPFYVEVRDADVLFEGQSYRSLSGVARHITKNPANGFAFFGLLKEPGTAPKKERAPRADPAERAPRVKKDPKDLQNVPLRLERSVVAKMDEAIARHGYKTRADFLRQAIEASLQQLTSGVPEATETINPA